MKAVKLPFWFLVGLGKTKLKCCIQVGIFGFTWEKTEDSKTDKRLRNYCVKENFVEKQRLWQKVLGDYSNAAVSENTCRAQPGWCVNVVWCHLHWADAAAALLCIDQTAEVSRSLQLWVWVTKLMHSASKGVWWWTAGLTLLVHFGWKTLSFLLPSLQVYTGLRTFSNSVCPSSFHVEATPFSFWHLSI